MTENNDTPSELTAIREAAGFTHEEFGVVLNPIQPYAWHTVKNWVITAEDVADLVTADDAEHALHMSGQLCMADAEEDRPARHLDDLRANFVCMALGMTIYAQVAMTERAKKKAFTLAWEVLSDNKPAGEAIGEFASWYAEFYQD